MTTTKADELVDQAAARLQELADRAAAEGGMTAKLAQPLADDAAFIRKLKPSLIIKRLRGNAPTNRQPAHGTVAPSAPQIGDRKPPKRTPGPNPWLVLGTALVAGIVLARIVDWRSHAHPRG
jgi:hypothetical protein